MELQKTKDISYALKAIEGHFPAAFRPTASVRKPEPQAAGYRQVRVDPLTNPVLLDYLKERGILPEIARKTCKEVHFENKGKWYFAVAFTNRSGGYEIRNKYLKGSISPKEITHIKNGGDHCIVVRRISGLSCHTSHLNQCAPQRAACRLYRIKFGQQCRQGYPDIKRI